MDVCLRFSPGDRLRVGRGATRAEDAHGTPTQSHISPSILVYAENGHVTPGYPGETYPVAFYPETSSSSLLSLQVLKGP